MSASDYAAWVSAVGTVVAAAFTAMAFGAAVWAARIARGAAATWRGVHEHAKADECIAAAFDLVHAIGRVVDDRRRLQHAERSPVTPAPFPSEAYDAAWIAWRRLQLAHVVAYRYHAARMNRGTPDHLAKILDDLKAWCASAPRDTSGYGGTVDRALFIADAAAGEAIVALAREEADAIDAALMPISAGASSRPAL